MSDEQLIPDDRSRLRPRDWVDRKLHDQLGTIPVGRVLMESFRRRSIKPDDPDDQ